MYRCKHIEQNYKEKAWRRYVCGCWGGEGEVGLTT